MSEHLFIWMAPDELVPTKIEKDQGIIGCAIEYYTNITLNRVTSVFTICSAGHLVNLFDSPLYGWIIARFLLFLSVPLSFAILMSACLKQKFTTTFSLGCVLASFAAESYLDSVNLMFGLDYVIYFVFTSLFILTISSMLKYEKNNRSKTFFYFIWFLFLNTHEIAFVLGGFLFLIFVLRKVDFTTNILCKSALLLIASKVFNDRGIWIVTFIYLTSFALTIFSPAYHIRMEIWPSNGTFEDAFIYSMLSLLEVIALLKQNWLPISLVIFIGLMTYFSSQVRISLDRAQLALLFTAPFIFVAITGFLVGLTPSLRIGSKFLIVDAHLSTLLKLFDEGQTTSLQGGLAPRHLIFFTIVFYTSCYFIGFSIACWLDKHLQHKRKNLKYSLSNLTIFSIILMLFVFHPNRSESLLYFSSAVDSDKKNLEKIEKAKTEIEERVPAEKDGLGNLFFTSSPHKHSNFIIHSLAVDKVLQENHSVSSDFLFELEKGSFPHYYTRDWHSYILELYRVKSQSACPRNVLKFTHQVEYCYSLMSMEKLQKKLKILAPPTTELLRFSDTQNVQVEENKKCQEIRDLESHGEHYIFKTVTFPAGINLIEITGVLSGEELGGNLYLIGDDTAIIFPHPNSGVASNGWVVTQNEGNNLEPLFSAYGVQNEIDKFVVAIENERPLNLSLRWQHSVGGTTIYRATGKSVTVVCSITHKNFQSW